MTAVSTFNCQPDTLLLPGKDRNLSGIFLALQQHAKERCGQNYDAILEATVTENWKWNGPEVTRTYPLDSDIERITPDSKGFRLVRYKVRLVYRDAQGRVSRMENFTATELWPGPERKK